jgi:hypothetical protein
MRRPCPDRVSHSEYPDASAGMKEKDDTEEAPKVGRPCGPSVVENRTLKICIAADLPSACRIVSPDE